MEENSRGLHSIQWKDRSRGSVTGVTDVLSFDETAVVLETGQGMLTLKGKELHIKRLLLEKGEVEIEGNLESLTYAGSHPGPKEGLLKRMFR